jgi:hypothetical protein
MILLQDRLLLYTNAMRKTVGFFSFFSINGESQYTWQIPKPSTFKKIMTHRDLPLFDQERNI